MYRFFFALALFIVVSADYPGCTFGYVYGNMGYSGMLVNGKPGSEAKNKEKVELLCGRDKHSFLCLSGNLMPVNQSQSRCGCDPVSKSGLDYEGDTYTRPITQTLITNDFSSHGRYSNGTKWTRTCSSGPVVEGASSSYCVDGQWVPKPGRCSWMCSIEQLRKAGGFSRITVYTWPHPEWLKTGEKAQGFCSVNILNVEHYGFECKDGNWVPENVTCLDHLRTN